MDDHDGDAVVGWDGRRTPLMPSNDMLDHPAVSSRPPTKVHAIQAAAAARDITALVDQATSPAGFIDDQSRRLAWPILLGCDEQSLLTWETLPSPGETTHESEEGENLPAHRDEHQAGLDVDRSFVYYPKDDSEKQIASRKEQLSTLIIQVLRRNPYLCYFQGYHDIAQVFLLVLGPERAIEAVERLSVLRIRDFMLPSLAAAMTHLELLPHILRATQPELERHLSQTRPFFALSATLTLYAHDIEEYGDIARLFDFFLAHPASVPVYFFATVVSSRKAELLEIEEDEPEMLHSVLSKLPKPLDVELLIRQTMQLYEAHPPESLPGNPWRTIDKHSVLKTTVGINSLRSQTLQQGQTWFRKQDQKLKRDQALRDVKNTMWAYRKPARSAGIAISIAILAWWLRRDTNAVPLMLTALRNCRSLCGL